MVAAWLGPRWLWRLLPETMPAACFDQRHCRRRLPAPSLLTGPRRQQGAASALVWCRQRQALAVSRLPWRCRQALVARVCCSWTLPQSRRCVLWLRLCRVCVCVCVRVAGGALVELRAGVPSCHVLSGNGPGGSGLTRGRASPMCVLCATDEQDRPFDERELPARASSGRSKGLFATLLPCLHKV